MSSERPRPRLPDPFRIPPPIPRWLKLLSFVGLALVCLHPLAIWWLTR